MGRAVITAVAVLGLIVLATRLTAQQPPEIKPGPEHAQFKEWEGTWDATIKGMGPESKGTATCKVGLNGLWLLEHFKGDFGGMPFEGYGATSYDPAKKKYINTWIDSMVTSPMITEGTYDKAKKTLTMVGEMPMPGGKTAKVTMTTVTKDTDTRIFTMNGPGPDGKVGEMFTIIYKRRAK
jgi:hypothetical protein